MNTKYQLTFCAQTTNNSQATSLMLTNKLITINGDRLDSGLRLQYPQFTVAKQQVLR